jgi:two-component system phosphate regulon response regulator PhoB
MAEKEKVLIVDDEQDVLELLVYNIKQANYQVITAEDGKEALWKVKVFSPDIIVLDIMLPVLSGFDVCKTLKSDPKYSRIPILMLTARAAENDRIKGFESGADDYLVKPFSMRELLIRIKKLLTAYKTGKPKVEILSHKGLVVDINSFRVSYNNKPIELTSMEFKLLCALMEKKGALVTRDQLLSEVWDYDAVIETRTVDAHISRLREKLGPAGKFIQTIHRLGYRFNG